MKYILNNRNMKEDPRKKCYSTVEDFQGFETSFGGNSTIHASWKEEANLGNETLGFPCQ